MDSDKHLILVKGEDKTKNITSCKYDDGKWHLIYENSNKNYPYNYLNVQWFKDPTVLDPATTIVYKNNHPISGIKKILDFGDYVKLSSGTGYTAVYSRNDIRLERSILNKPNAKNCFEYLRQLATITSFKDEDDSSFLSKQYNKITFVSPGSVLAKYLSPSEYTSNKHSIQMPIFPFGFNLSQKKATEKALAEQISIIEGPPGTGKTQTILNIIANAVMEHKTVAVVSNNNSATANVLEKLQKYGVDFIAAYLGNKDNKDRFFAQQSQIYPDMSTWLVSETDYQKTKKALFESGEKLEQMLEAKNNAAILKQELSLLSIEKKYFDTYYNESLGKISSSYRSIYKQNADAIMALWIDYQQMIEKNRPIRFAYKLKNLLRYGIFDLSFYNLPDEHIIAFFQKRYYERRIVEITNKIRSLDAQLSSFQFEKGLADYSQISMRLFKAILAKRYIQHKVRPAFTKDSLWKDFEPFIKEYPVILSTTHSLRTCASANYLFDYVIMDEASQVDIVTGALALSCAKNAIIVGDLKQLPNIVSAELKQKTDRIFNNFSLPSAYRYSENILSSMKQLFTDVPATLLKEHYRCHPKIIGFCNQKFYNNELIVLTEEKGRDKPLAVYKTAKGNHARGHYNQRQIDVILQEVIPEQGIDESRQTLGIVSPYRKQTDKLIEAVGDKNIQVDTVHKYQGRERDVIILTTVVNEMNDFVDQPNLVNVAVSRAVDKLIVVISDNEKNANSNIGDLVKYIEYNNFDVINSNIYSVFDLLYHSYSKQLFEQMKHRKKVSKYESENLMNALIEKVLSSSEYSNLGHVMHQPLKMLIRNPEKLNEAESRYAMNVLTHTDFVIFNKLDKMPVLVVEVDGYAFHANNPKQLERDRMKDAILAKYGIPILRVKTNESNEENRLRNKLNEILLGN